MGIAYCIQEDATTPPVHHIVKHFQKIKPGEWRASCGEHRELLVCHIFIYSTFVSGKFTWIWRWSNLGEWYEATAAGGVSGNRFCCTSSHQPEQDGARARYIPQQLAKVAENYPRIVQNCARFTQNDTALLMTDIIDIYCVTYSVEYSDFFLLLTRPVRGRPSETVASFIINWKDFKNYKCALMHW